MIAQQQETPLSQLRQFLQQISRQTDPYWHTILQSDIRNILPKHEVCKIQLVKNNISKTRLILQNLNTFISLEIQKKHLKDQMIDLNQNITQQLQSIVEAQKTPLTINHFHYDTSLNKRKRQLEIIAKQLSRSKTSNQLKILIQKNNKWQQYIQKNIKQLQKVTQSDIHQDITNFIKTYHQLFITNQSQQATNIHSPCKETYDQIILKSGCYVKLYENKLHQQILVSKLLDDIYGCEEQINNELLDQDDYWKQEIKKIRELNDI